MRPTTVALAQVEGDVSLAALASAVGEARNVGAVVLDPEHEAQTRVRAAFEEIDRRRTTYVVTDADPYEALREAFVASWQKEQLEDFEVAALGAGPTPLPDFYVVLDPGTTDTEEHGERYLVREWFFGVLGNAAPSRILPLPAAGDPGQDARAVLERLAQLPMGPPLPAPQELIAQVRRCAPGVVVGAGEPERPRLL